MAREGTRSATGNSKPRVFQTVDTAPVIKRVNKPKTKKAASPTAGSAATTDDAPKPVKAKAKAAKPMGVTKKKAAPKKNGVGAKVKAAAKKVEATTKKAAAKPKTAAAK